MKPSSEFEKNYFEVDGIRLHYVDEGQGPPILMVHGNGLAWSFTYRKMILPLAEAGYRCIAPDLMGFGLSDKPGDESKYTVQRHVRHITSLVEHLDLRGVTIVGHDWGGPISLRYAIEHQENVRALVVLNTLVRTSSGLGLFGLLFANNAYSSFLVQRLDLFRRFLLLGAFRRRLEPSVKKQYLMPHPTPESRAGMAAFPKLIPTGPDHPNAAYIDEIEQTLTTWDIPVLVIWADKDMAFKVEEGKRIARIVPDGRFHLIHGAGHYLQEDAGEEIAARMIPFLRDEAGITSITE